MESKIRVHIIPEYGIDFRPHSSAYIRLIRPFFHPSVSESVQASQSYSSIPQDAKIVIVDRFWRPDVNLDLAKRLIENIHTVGASFVYCFDDDFFQLKKFRNDFPTPRHIEVLEYFLNEADSLLVTTTNLKENYGSYCQNIQVLPNMLDDRLLVKKPKLLRSIEKSQILKIGYMGTLTHQIDLELIYPTLIQLKNKYQSQIIFEFIGGLNEKAAVSRKWKDLAIHFVEIPIYENEYPLFMLWYTSTIGWDIALAPLQDQEFNQAKSYIKYLDYSAVAAAGVFSNVNVYNEIIQNGENGLLVNNENEWLDGLIELIENEKLRKKISDNAKKDLWNNHTIQRNAQKIISIVKNSIRI